MRGPLFIDGLPHGADHKYSVKVQAVGWTGDGDNRFTATVNFLTQ